MFCGCFRDFSPTFPTPPSTGQSKSPRVWPPAPRSDSMGWRRCVGSMFEAGFARLLVTFASNSLASRLPRTLLSIPCLSAWSPGSNSPSSIGRVFHRRVMRTFASGSLSRRVARSRRLKTGRCVAMRFRDAVVWAGRLVRSSRRTVRWRRDSSVDAGKPPEASRSSSTCPKGTGKVWRWRRNSVWNRYSTARECTVGRPLSSSWNEYSASRRWNSVETSRD